MYDPEGLLDTKCSSMSPKSPEMRYYYCQIDALQGMQSCGLNETMPEGRERLDPQTANRSVTIKDVKRSLGHACYYRFKSEK